MPDMVNLTKETVTKTVSGKPIINDPQCSHLLPELYDIYGNVIPPCFDPRRLTRLELEQIAWWDETHPNLKIGTVTNKAVNNERVQVRFPRYYFGNLNAESGLYVEEI